MQHIPLKKARAETRGNLKLWLLGAVLITIILGVYRGTRAADTIIDDGDAGYADTGWSTALDQGYPLDPGMDVHFIAAGDGSHVATWTPTIPVTGLYDVYISWTTHPNRATNAPYTVNHAGGASNYVINQELLADQLTTGGSGQWSDWRLLGTLTFNAGSSHTITLDNNANEYVIADALRLVPVAPATSDVSGTKFEDLDGNGIKDGADAVLAGWTIAAAESFQTFVVDSNDSIGITSNALTNGEIYLVRVEGTYDAGDTITADAKYSVRAPNIYWTDSVQNYTSYGPELLDLQVDGVSPDWGPYHANHIYWFNVLGAGAGKNFKIYDLGYGGNVGSLSVNIYHVIAQTITDANGLYAMTSIPSGNFIVAEIPQTGWLQTAPGGGFHTISAEGAFTNLDFGNQRTPSIRGMKFDDINGNGVKEPNEPGLMNWTIDLTDTTTGLVTSAITDAAGNYVFTQLPPGAYTVEETPQPGWTQTFPSNPSFYTIALAQGQQVINTNFGNFNYFDIHGVKYEDMNGNGTYDTGEQLLPNWEIKLTTPTTTLTALTDVDGEYSFTNLGPGAYIIAETLQPGWGQSEPSLGSYDVEGQSDAVFTDVNFGNYLFVSINGKKYQDNNFNGVRNASDPFLGGWTIELTSLRDGKKQTAVTKANNPNKGSYIFANIRPGNYLVREILKTGWLPVNPKDTIYRVTVVSNQILENIDFGNNTIRNYAIWRISHPNAFVSPLTIQDNQAIVPTPDVTPQVNAPEGSSTSPMTDLLPKDPPLPIPPEFELPKIPKEPPVSADAIIKKVFERISRLLPRV